MGSTQIAVLISRSYSSAPLIMLRSNIDDYLSNHSPGLLSLVRVDYILHRENLLDDRLDTSISEPPHKLLQRITLDIGGHHYALPLATTKNTWKQESTHSEPHKCQRRSARHLRKLGRGRGVSVRLEVQLWIVEDIVNDMVEWCRGLKLAQQWPVIVVKDLIGAQRSTKVCIARRARDGDVGTDDLRDLDPECADAATAAIDEQARALFDVRHDGIMRSDSRNGSASRVKWRNIAVLWQQSNTGSWRSDILCKTSADQGVGAGCSINDVTGVQSRIGSRRDNTASDIKARRRGLLDCEFADGRFGGLVVDWVETNR